MTRTVLHHADPANRQFQKRTCQASGEHKLRVGEAHKRRFRHRRAWHLVRDLGEILRILGEHLRWSPDDVELARLHRNVCDRLQAVVKRSEEEFRP